MKRLILFIFLLMIVPIMTSCNNDKYKQQKEKIKNIDINNYMNTVQYDRYKETIYNSKNTMSIYHLYEYDDRLELIQVESFMSLELLKDLDKVESSSTISTGVNVLNSLSTVPSTSPSTEVENFEIQKTKIVYENESYHVDIDNVNYDLNEQLNTESFIDYCEKYFNDEFTLISDTIYGIIQEVMNYGKIELYGPLNFENRELLAFHAQISIYDMRSNYVADTNKSFYLDMLVDYIGEDKYTMFMENVYNETQNVMFGAGPIDVLFYVSSDFTAIYPWIDMFNDDGGIITFYKTILD